MRNCAVVACFLLFQTLYAQTNTATRAVRIQELKISGISQISRADLLAVEDELKRQCCNFAETQEIREQILFAFEERGYLKAKATRR